MFYFATYLPHTYFGLELIHGPSESVVDGSFFAANALETRGDSSEGAHRTFPLQGACRVVE